MERFQNGSIVIKRRDRKGSARKTVNSQQFSVVVRAFGKGFARKGELKRSMIQKTGR